MSHVYTQPVSPPLYASHITGMTGTHHHAWLFIG
jgi:hypothetical protein